MATKNLGGWVKGMALADGGTVVSGGQRGKAEVWHKHVLSEMSKARGVDVAARSSVA